MKTLQELYNEIVKNDELKKKFTEAAKDNKIVDFAKANGVETTLDEIKAFLEDKQKADMELDPSELENAAGGTCNRYTVGEAVLSVGLFAGCTVILAVSATEDKVGQSDDEYGRLCNRG